MPDARTLPIPAKHREFTVKVGGQEVPRSVQLQAAYVVKEANKLSSARLVYLDGSASKQDFPLSNADTFIPGTTIEVLAGPPDAPASIFKGVVVRNSLKVRGHTAPQLVVDCRHAAVKMTLNRKNAYYFDELDSDVMSTLLSNAGLNADVEATTVTYKQQVQYYCSDWDYLVMRADANGKLVYTNDDTVSVKAPVFGAAATMSLQFGATLLELDTEMDARYQYGAVKSSTWDSAQQAVSEKDGTDPSVSAPGNLSSSTLAGVFGMDLQLQHVSLVDDESQAWADAEWLRSQMSRVNGRMQCEGVATVNPGDTVAVAGVGDRFNGNVFVTGVRQDFDKVKGWKTHIQFGGTEKWLQGVGETTAPKASDLLPGINGLQTGVVVSNEDPDGEFRVRVRMPLVDSGSDGTWARVAVPDGGDTRGFFFRPEVGDEVVLGFLNDDPREAVILGMLNSSAKPAPLQGSDANNEKVIQTRSAMKIYLNDDEKVMQFETPAGNKITMSENDQSITIADQNGNSIEMTPSGIKIESSQTLELKAGADLTMSSSTSLSATGGSDLTLKGTSSAELSSSATTSVKGSIVQIN